MPNTKQGSILACIKIPNPRGDALPELSSTGELRYAFDTFSFSLGMLGSVKEEARDLYDTYAARIDSLLLMNTRTPELEPTRN